MESFETDFQYDDNVFSYLLEHCYTYEELRLQCDMHNIEYIITETELKDYLESRPCKSIYAINISSM